MTIERFRGRPCVSCIFCTWVLIKISLCCWLFLSLSCFVVQVVTCFLKLQSISFCVVLVVIVIFYFVFFLVWLIKHHWRVLRFVLLVFVYHTWVGYLCVFFLQSWVIVTSWFFLTCSLILLYSVEGKSNWIFELISFISCSLSLIVTSQNFIVIFMSCFGQSSWIVIAFVNKFLILIPNSGFKIDF